MKATAVTGYLDEYIAFIEEATGITVPETDYRSLRDAVEDVETLRAHVAERLAAYKVPAIVHVHADPLPRNPAGKLLKAVLKREYGAA